MQPCIHKFSFVLRFEPLVRAALLGLDRWYVCPLGFWQFFEGKRRLRDLLGPRKFDRFVVSWFWGCWWL